MRRETRELLFKDTSSRKRYATEQVRCRVECAFSPIGHWVTLTRAQDGTLLAVESECRDADVEAGEAVTRLGGQHCAKTVHRVRESILVSGYYEIKEAMRHVPDALQRPAQSVRTSRETLHGGRTEAKAVKPDCQGFENKERMYVTLAAKHGSVVAGFPIKVYIRGTSEGIDEYRISLVTNNGESSDQKHVVALRAGTGRGWKIDERAVRRLVSPEKREPVNYIVGKDGCLACRRGGAPQPFKSPTSHARTKAHADNVIAGLYRVVKLLTPGRDKRISSLVSRVF